jgi:hypothetical protein
MIWLHLYRLIAQALPGWSEIQIHRLTDTGQCGQVEKVAHHEDRLMVLLK